MATTRIMPLHVGKGRTESRAISDIIDYVANPKKTDNGRLITGYACDSRTADAEFLLAKRQYIAATGRVRGTDDVIVYHVRQSFRPGEITQEEANRLGVEFARRFTKENHAFVVCTHIDKSHIPNGTSDCLTIRKFSLMYGIFIFDFFNTIFIFVFQMNYMCSSTCYITLSSNFVTNSSVENMLNNRLKL